MARGGGVEVNVNQGTFYFFVSKGTRGPHNDYITRCCAPIASRKPRKHAQTHLKPSTRSNCLVLMVIHSFFKGNRVFFLELFF